MTETVQAFLILGVLVGFTILAYAGYFYWFVSEEEKSAYYPGVSYDQLKERLARAEAAQEKKYKDCAKYRTLYYPSSELDKLRSELADRDQMRKARRARQARNEACYHRVAQFLPLTDTFTLLTNHFTHGKRTSVARRGIAQKSR